LSIRTSHFWFHPGGRHVAVGQLEGVRVWDLLTGKTIADCKMPERVGSKVGHGCYLACAALSPDARRLATGLPNGSILVWEVKRPDESTGPLGAKALAELWEDMASADSGKAWTAVRKLAAVPSEAIPFLANRVKPVPNALVDVTKPLIEALDSDDFRQRETAAKKLVELGPKAEAALRAAFAASQSAEQARRIEDLLIRVEKIVEPAGGEVRDLRAVAVLRLAGTAEAKKILQELAKGVERANLTREARSTLAAMNGQ
jgi:DNA-directed RNA polymerase subunit F